MEFLKVNGSDGIVFKELRYSGTTQLVVFPPTAGNEKTERYLEATAEPFSSGALVYTVAKSALDNFNKLTVVK